MPRTAAALFSLLLLASAAPALSAPLGGAPGALSVATPFYEADVSWPAAGEPAEALASLVVRAGGRTATFDIAAPLASDVYVGEDTPLRPILVSAQTSTSPTPRVRLVYDVAGLGVVGETTSTLVLTFHDDHLVYESALRMANAIVGPYLQQRTTLEWDDAWPTRGVIDTAGTLWNDTGVRLDAYQGWQNVTDYGVFFADGSQSVAQARLRSSPDVNYIPDGEWRVSREDARTLTHFDAFLDLPSAGMEQPLWARDALLFGATPEALAQRIDELARREAIPTTVASQDAQTVVAIVDTGINPYHVAFRDTSPLAYQHPSTYIPGYPADAIAVPLTLDAPTIEDALDADAAAWASLRPDTLYWFPGTKIVGGISSGVGAEDDSRLVFSTGHGTMTASRAAGNDYSLCPECRIVAVQAGNILADDGTTYVRWLAAQTWVDIQSHSWSGLVPFQNEVEVPGIRGAMEDAAAQMPVFASGGNGAAGKGGVLGHPSFTRPISGAEGVIPVGGHDNGYVTAWTAQYPYLAADACSSWAPVGTTLEEFSPEEGSGTSASTPYAAGAAGRIILEARRVLGGPGDRADGIFAEGAPRPELGASPLADGVFTLDELKSVLFRTATPRPEATRDDGVVCGASWTPANTLPLAWKDHPEDVSAYPFIGWGGIDVTSRERSLAVLHGAPMPVRPVDEEAHAQAETMRAAYRAVEPETPGLPSAPQDDAGSGGDAPSTYIDAPLVQPGIVYEADLLALRGDTADRYALDVQAGDTLQLRVRGLQTCVALLHPSISTALSYTCSDAARDALVGGDVTYTFQVAGTFYIQVAGSVDQRYAFGFGLNAPPPAVELPAQA